MKMGLKADSSNLVVVKLQGGLGNQLFQYATGFALAKTLDCQLMLDARFVGLGSNRIYQLNQLNISGKLASYPLLDYLPAIKSQKRFNRDYRVRGKKLKHITEPHFHYWDKLQSFSGRIYLDGYWQSHKYFATFKKELVKEFSLRCNTKNDFNAMSSRISQNMSLGVHIRRGDYATNKITRSYHGVLNQFYFKNAIDHLGSSLNKKNIFYFTDDTNWVKSNFDTSEEQIISLQNFTDTEELFLFSLTKKKVLSNSTFSWWGAWLGDNTGVVAPKKWFAPRSSHNTQDLFLNEWKLM